MTEHDTGQNVRKEFDRPSLCLRHPLVKAEHGEREDADHTAKPCDTAVNKLSLLNGMEQRIKKERGYVDDRQTKDEKEKHPIKRPLFDPFFARQKQKHPKHCHNANEHHERVRRDLKTENMQMREHKTS
ncbi:MAG: hypothetical protein IJU20_00340 [Clostridia bacterium]|nr:hypothetical protein [Clostridia bacterium]